MFYNKFIVRCSLLADCTQHYWHWIVSLSPVEYSQRNLGTTEKFLRYYSITIFVNFITDKCFNWIHKHMNYFLETIVKEKLTKIVAVELAFSTAHSWFNFISNIQKVFYLQRFVLDLKWLLIRNLCTVTGQLWFLRKE